MEVEEPVEVLVDDETEVIESVDGVSGTGREEGEEGVGDLVLLPIVDGGRVIEASIGRGSISDLSLSFSISMKSSTCTLGGRLVFGLYRKSREPVSVGLSFVCF